MSQTGEEDPALQDILLQIDAVLLDLTRLQAKCILLIQSPNQEFQHLSTRILELLDTYQELKRRRVDSGFFDNVEDAQVKQTAMVKLLRVFLASPELHNTLHELQVLEKKLRGEEVEEVKNETSQVPLLDSLCNTFTSELKQLTVLETQLQDYQNRLRQRDEYMQSTIAETSKRVHFLEQYVAELELQRESNWSVKSHKDLIVKGGLVLHTPGKGSIEDLELDGFEKITIPKDIDFISLGERAIELSLDKSREGESGSEPRKRSIDDVTEEDFDAQDSDLLNLMQTLTTLAEEKELLEQDLCIVRLQVEHLEAIGRERDAVIATLYKKREQRLSIQGNEKRVSIQHNWVR